MHVASKSRWWRAAILLIPLIVLLMWTAAPSRALPSGGGSSGVGLPPHAGLPGSKAKPPIPNGRFNMPGPAHSAP